MTGITVGVTIIGNGKPVMLTGKKYYKDEIVLLMDWLYLTIMSTQRTWLTMGTYDGVEK